MPLLDRVLIRLLRYQQTLTALAPFFAVLDAILLVAPLLQEHAQRRRARVARRPRRPPLHRLTPRR